MINDLLNRMIDDLQLPGDLPSTSWLAHREAEKMEDETLIPSLMELIESLKDNKSKLAREKRDAIYFILKWIGINTKNRQVPEILMQCLEFETNMYIVGNLLDYIRKQNGYIPDYNKIIHLLENKRWQVRFPAIDLLGKCKEEEVEKALLEILEKSNDSYEVGAICNALNNIGTVKAIPLLIEKTNHKDRWIRSNSYETLYTIGNRDVLPVFIDGLNDRFYCSKHNALIGVCKYDDGSKVDLVYKCVNNIFSYSRILDSNESKPTDLVEGLKYLKKHIKEKDKINLIILKIKQSKNELFSEKEKEFFNKNEWK